MTKKKGLTTKERYITHHLNWNKRYVGFRNADGKYVSKLVDRKPVAVRKMISRRLNADEYASIRKIVDMLREGVQYNEIEGVCNEITNIFNKFYWKRVQILRVTIADKKAETLSDEEIEQIMFVENL